MHHKSLSSHVIVANAPARHGGGAVAGGGLTLDPEPGQYFVDTHTHIMYSKFCPELQHTQTLKYARVCAEILNGGGGYMCDHIKANMQN